MRTFETCEKCHTAVLAAKAVVYAGVLDGKPRYYHKRCRKMRKE